jgi:hypothetical protein
MLANSAHRLGKPDSGKSQSCGNRARSLPGSTRPSHRYRPARNPKSIPRGNGRSHDNNQAVRNRR